MNRVENSLVGWRELTVKGGLLEAGSEGPLYLTSVGKLSGVYKQELNGFCVSKLRWLYCFRF